MYNYPVNIDNTPALPLRHKAWKLLSFDNLELIRLHLDPGESMENHINDWRIVFHVLAGSGTLDVEGDPILLGKGQSIAVRAGVERSWSNQGTTTLEILVIKSLNTSHEPVP